MMNLGKHRIVDCAKHAQHPGSNNARVFTESRDNQQGACISMQLEGTLTISIMSTQEESISAAQRRLQLLMAARQPC